MVKMSPTGFREPGGGSGAYTRTKWFLTCWNTYIIPNIFGGFKGAPKAKHGRIPLFQNVHLSMWPLPSEINLSNFFTKNNDIYLFFSSYSLLAVCTKLKNALFSRTLCIRVPAHLFSLELMGGIEMSLINVMGE